VPLRSTSKKAEEFARLLDGGGSGSGELSTMGNLAHRLSAVPQPRPEFASALRTRLMQEATGTLPAATGTGVGSAGPGAAGPGAAGPATSSAVSSSATTTSSAVSSSAVSSVLSSTAPLWAKLAAGVAAAAIAATGVGVGASRSLPGDPLYGLKRRVETVQLDLAGGGTSKALAQLGFASSRLDEIAALLKHDGTAAPLSADLQKQISGLLQDWAVDTSKGTTPLLDQLKAGQGNSARIVGSLISFTDAQTRALAAIVQQLPDQTLQSLTGSGFAYLQRVDTALGGPVGIPRLLRSLGLDLPSVSGAAAKPAPVPSGGSPVGTPSPPPVKGAGSSAGTPTSVPTLPIPTNGKAVPRNPSTGLPSLPTVPSNGTGTVPGTVGGSVGSTVSGASKTVDGVLNGVTGNGPALPLPTSVPTVPGLPR
jgi:hypothetical protein